MILAKGKDNPLFYFFYIFLLFILHQSLFINIQIKNHYKTKKFHFFIPNILLLFFFFLKKHSYFFTLINFYYSIKPKSKQNRLPNQPGCFVNFFTCGGFGMVEEPFCGLWIFWCILVLLR
jgi:hypothetical protein